MKLTVIGCSGSVSGPDSPASCYLVQHGDCSLVLDLGPGSFGRLLGVLDPAEVDAWCFSHLHPDHCSDFCSLHVAAHHSPSAPWPRRPVFGPAGTRERLQRLYEVTPEQVAEPGADWDDWTFQTWRPEQQIGPFTVTTVTSAHPVDAVAMRLEAGGRSLTYTGDTGPSALVTELAAGSDVLLSEAAFIEPGEPDLHLTGTQAGELARDAGVGRLLITHVPPWYSPAVMVSQARRVYGGSIEAVRPGLSLEI